MDAVLLTTIQTRLGAGVRFIAVVAAGMLLSSCKDDGSSTYALNAYVSGLSGSGLQVTVNGGAPISIPANSQTTIAHLTNGTRYTVAINSEPVDPVQTCTATNPSGKIAGNNVDVMINCVVANTAVPDVVGLAEAAATNAITSAGLTLGAVTMQSSATVAVGLVISESPNAGSSVAAQSPVNLVISSGVAKVPVPNVGGLTQAAAMTAITGAGLTVGTVAMQSSATVAAGLVISENPTAGTTVANGTGVNLVVSSGAAPVVVPNVVGLTQAAASSAITGAGLEVGTITMQSSATVATGLVISESPSAGSSVAANSAVHLVVSSGVAKVAVPNVVGLTQAAAPTAITGAGLTVGTVTSQSSTTVAAGLVISESPTAGTIVATGSAVNIIVSSGGVSGTSKGGSPITVSGLGQVTFPAGYLSGSTTATLLVSNTEAIATALATGTDILGPLTQAISEIHVQFSSAPLTAGEFNISLKIPGELQSAISQGGQPTILVAFHYLSQDSEASEDATDFDQIDNVSYDPTTQVVSGQVPISAIDTIFGPTLEAVLKIVVFPSAQIAPTTDTTQSIKKVLALSSNSGGQTTSPPLLYPLVAAPPLIIGPFGEPGHAGGSHGGIDLRTLGTGKQVQAVADGWISQISLSSGKTNCCASPQPAYCGTVAAAPTTYAKPGANPYTLSIVQQLSSGGAVAYRHLMFGSVSASGVTSISSQLCYIDNGSHAISVKQGDIIALSGDSGAPGAPHLHFEYTSQSAAGVINSQKGAFRQNGIFQLGQLEMSLVGQQVNASSPMGLDLAATGSQVQAQIVASTAAQILVRRYKPPSLGNPDANGCYAGEVCLPSTAQDTGNSATFQSGSSYPIFAFNGPPTLWSGYDPTIASITNPAVKNTQCPTLVNGVSTDCGLYTISAANGSAAGLSTRAIYTLIPKGRYVGATGTVSTESIVWNLGETLHLFGRGINNAETIVGGVCSAGQGYFGYFECGSATLGDAGAPIAAATIGGIFYPALTGLVQNLSACGFGDPYTQAVAVSAAGEILVEGDSPPLNGLGYENTVNVVCRLTPATPLADGTPQFKASALNFEGRGINSQGSIVGGVCPAGQAYVGYFECGSANVPPGTSSAVAAALIGGIFYPTLTSLVQNLSACGFGGPDSQALAVAENGSILVEGDGPANSEVTVVCLLTPTTATSNGTPQYTASALNFEGRGINSQGTIVGGVCPTGQGYFGYFECGSAALGPFGGPPVAAALIGGTFYPTLTSLVQNLSACGFGGPDSQALAVAENGSILVEGDGPATSEVTVVCLLTPTTPLANGTPQFVAAPL